ncbi:unnamed protein product, partial [Discosporangium mesarthrocarpum]
MQQLQIQQAQLQHEQMKLDMFWRQVVADLEAIDPEKEDFKGNDLPLARIKKIMRLEDEVREPGSSRFMISAEAPVVLAKACEMFILEMAMRASTLTEENKRRTLQRHDIAMAVSKADTYDFLIDIVPREEVKKDDGVPGTGGMEIDQQQLQQLMAMQQHSMALQMAGLAQQQGQPPHSSGGGTGGGTGGVGAAAAVAQAQAQAAHMQNYLQQQQMAAAANPQMA